MEALDDTIDLQIRGLKRSLDVLFDEGFSSQFSTDRLDQSARAVRLMRDNCTTTAKDSGMLSEEGRHSQKLASDSTVAVVLTTTTLGVGAGVGALSAGGRLAHLGNASRIGLHAGLNAVSSSTLTTGLRESANTSAADRCWNFAGAAVEGVLVAAPSLSGILKPIISFVSEKLDEFTAVTSNNCSTDTILARTEQARAAEQAHWQ